MYILLLIHLFCHLFGCLCLICIHVYIYVYMYIHVHAWLICTYIYSRICVPHRYIHVFMCLTYTYAYIHVPEKEKGIHACISTCQVRHRCRYNAGRDCIHVGGLFAILGSLRACIEGFVVSNRPYLGYLMINTMAHVTLLSIRATYCLGCECMVFLFWPKLPFKNTLAWRESPGPTLQRQLGTTCRLYCYYS